MFVLIIDGTVIRLKLFTSLLQVMCIFYFVISFLYIFFFELMKIQKNSSCIQKLFLACALASVYVPELVVVCVRYVCKIEYTHVRM